MKKLLLLLGGISAAVAVGCVMSPGESSPTGVPNQELTFGDTPIIRPEMEKIEVETMLGEQGVGTYVDASTHSPVVFSYPEAGIKIAYIDDKVESCRTTTAVVSGSFQRETIADSTLKQLLRPGMSPKDVATKLGQTKCGYENVPGRVVLIHGKGVETAFVDFALKQWRRTTYSAETTRRTIYSAEPMK